MERMASTASERLARRIVANPFGSKVWSITLTLAPSVYRERLARHEELVHLSLEVNRCPNAQPT